MARPVMRSGTAAATGRRRLVLGTLAALAGAAARAQAPGAASGGAGYADAPGPAAADAAPAEPPPVMRPPAVDTLATVRRRGLLRVGVVQVPPMVMRDRQDRLVGYSVDLARRLADDLGVELAFVEASWPEVIPLLLSQRCDLLLTGLWVNVPRALVVNFTRPTVTEGLYLFGAVATASSRRSAEAFDAPGVRIAVAADPAQQRVAAARFPRARRLVADADPMALLQRGGADAALLATIAPEAVVAAAPRRWFLASTQPLARTSAAIAVRKGDPDFLAFLDTWLDLQREQGWLDERARHWATSLEGFR